MVENGLDGSRPASAAVGAPWGLWVEVRAAVVRSPAPEIVRRSLAQQDSRGEASYGWADDPGGVFVVVRREGVPTRQYDAVLESHRLLSAASGLDVRSDEALLEFVNTWGLLG